MPDPRSNWETDVDTAMRECVAVFGDGTNADGSGKVAYTHADGTSYAVDGIFEAASEVVSLENGAEVVSYQPTLSASLSAFQQMPGRGDTLIVRGTNYRVAKPDFDGQGTVSLRLKEV